jgi:carboxyvinyl-carboxyphosphonate phosphorylmutase
MGSGAERLRKLLEDGRCTPAAPIFDPLSARVAELVGWEVAKLSGSVAKAADLAVPDGAPVANLSDLVDECRRTARVSDISLIVDADDGGGGVLNVLRTVRELEAAGVAAIEIEDNTVPLQLNTQAGRHAAFVSVGQQIAKLRAAAAARRNPSTLIVARTSALTELPLGEALERIKAYSGTGADAMMLPKRPPNGRSDYEEVHAVCELPLFILGLDAQESADKEFLAANRILVRYMGQPTFRAALRATYDSLRSLREEAGLPVEAAIESHDELLAQVTRKPDFLAWENHYPSA